MLYTCWNILSYMFHLHQNSSCTTHVVLPNASNQNEQHKLSKMGQDNQLFRSSNRLGPYVNVSCNVSCNVSFLHLLYKVGSPPLHFTPLSRGLLFIWNLSLFSLFLSLEIFLYHLSCISAFFCEIYLWGRFCKWLYV